MPNPENIEPYQMKKGETLNPNGRPRKLISDVIVNLEAMGIKPATKTEIQDIYMRLINMELSEVKKAVEDKEQPALVRIVGKSILSGKGFEIIEKMLDRSIGRSEQGIKVDGEITISYKNVSTQFQED
jgi:seryl-tRNA synthetase